MRTLRGGELLLVIALVSVWVVCTTLHVQQVAAGQLAWVGVYVTPAAAADGYPAVRGFWPGARHADAGGLQPGDRVLRAGTESLRGVGRIGFAARVYEAAAARRDLRVPITYARDGRIARTRLALQPVAYPWRVLPLTGTLVVTAVLVLARRPDTAIARGFLLLAVAYALHWTFFFGGPRWQTYVWVGVFFVASLLMLPLILRTALQFPPEAAPPDGRLPHWPWLFALFGPISLSWVFGVPLAPEIGFRAAFLVNVAFIATLLVVLTRNFRRAGAHGRRQLKWVVLGMYLGTMPVLLADVVGAAVPALWWLHEPAVIAEILIPLSVLVAIVRANLFDVDRLITGAALYTVLTVLVLAALLSAVPPVTAAVSAAGDLDPRWVQMLLSLVAAAAIVPAQRLLRPRLERLLFRERHALHTGIEALLRALAAAPGADALFTLAGERLAALLRPRACVIYAPLGAQLVPLVAPVATRGAPRPLPVAAELAAALRQRTTPLDLRAWTPVQALDAEERAALTALDAAVAVPVHRGGELAAVVVLGTKSSGDVYTPTDLALLAAVGETLSGALRRFDAAVILEQERAMREALRRYVPEPVAARLTRGESLDGGERDVSVLFVDIQGYTTLSEQQAADAVFALVNRYTEAVSAVIQRRGGTVVEFLGDGVMAVFGAPDPIANPARAAVRAAREVIAAVDQLPAPAGGAPLTAGVGIASGRAFVGNVRTNDRLVYTAVGDVVNLASRIERLTRELPAAVAIDAATHAAAGAAAAHFRRHENVRIRGRVEPVDIWALDAPAIGHRGGEDTKSNIQSDQLP